MYLVGSKYSSEIEYACLSPSDQISIPNMLGGFTPTVTAAPGDPMHSSEYIGTPYTHTQTYIQKHLFLLSQ